jgi:hypothetical protein
MSEVSLYGLRPTARLGAWPSVLSQNDKDGQRGLPESAEQTAQSSEPRADRVPECVGPSGQ